VGGFAFRDDAEIGRGGHAFSVNQAVGSPIQILSSDL